MNGTAEAKPGSMDAGKQWAVKVAPIARKKKGKRSKSTQSEEAIALESERS